MVATCTGEARDAMVMRLILFLCSTLSAITIASFGIYTAKGPQLLVHRQTKNFIPYLKDL